ncbi:hypothetical protein ASE63_08605 [Bosea sp. Root381]|nr:hypothetical protein ASE63_08605 [Bosea sp. Root381]
MGKHGGGAPADRPDAPLLGEASWQEFLDTLNAFVPGGISTFFFHDERTQAGGIPLASALQPSTAEDYADFLQRRDIKAGIGASGRIRSVDLSPCLGI